MSTPKLHSIFEEKQLSKRDDLKDGTSTKRQNATHHRPLSVYYQLVDEIEKLELILTKARSHVGEEKTEEQELMSPENRKKHHKMLNYYTNQVTQLTSIVDALHEISTNVGHMEQELVKFDSLHSSDS